MGNDNTLLLVFPDEFSESYVNTEDHKQEIKKVIAERIGKIVEIEIRKNETERPAEESYPELRNLINFEVTVEN